MFVWVALVFPSFGQNLIVNGDFEASAAGTLPVTGWSTTSGIAVINGGSSANTGSKILLLAPNIGVGSGAQQTGIATLTGRNYLLEYFFVLPGNAAPTTFWNGVALGAPLATFTSTTNSLWTGVRYLVTGGAGTSTLAFQTGAGTVSVIDTVSLVVVPELNTAGAKMAGFIMVLIGLTLWSRRRPVALVG